MSNSTRFVLLMPALVYLARCGAAFDSSTGVATGHLSSQSRQARFLNLFTIIRFPNNPCSATSVGTNRTGICLTASQCSARNGTSGGSCAKNNGVCCIVTLSGCGLTSRDNVTYWSNPGGAGGFNLQQTCSLRVNKVNPNVCQLRLDFESFVLANPTDGNCDTDRFTVSGQDINSAIPTLCGTNTGQHIYVDIGSSQGPITLNVITSGTTTTTARRWSIKITQIQCSSLLRATQGCLQYYTGANGIIESFNYASTATSTYFNNLEYSICYRKELGFCSYTLTQADTTTTPMFIQPAAAVAVSNAGAGDTDCPNDYLIVHNLRLCGERLNDDVAGVATTTSVPVTDATTGIFQTIFKSDGTTANRGFRLNFRQNPCGSTGR